MGKKSVVELQFPLAGLNRAASYQKQPPYTTQDCSNVFPFDQTEGRARGGSRPGLGLKSIAGGGATAIQALDAVDAVDANYEVIVNNFDDAGEHPKGASNRPQISEINVWPAYQRSRTSTTCTVTFEYPLALNAHASIALTGIGGTGYSGTVTADDLTINSRYSISYPAFSGSTPETPAVAVAAGGAMQAMGIQGSGYTLSQIESGHLVNRLPTHELGWWSSANLFTAISDFIVELLITPINGAWGSLFWIYTNADSTAGFRFELNPGANGIPLVQVYNVTSVTAVARLVPTGANVSGTGKVAPGWFKVKRTMNGANSDYAVYWQGELVWEYANLAPKVNPVTMSWAIAAKTAYGASTSSVATARRSRDGSNIATFTTASNHGLLVNDIVVVSAMTDTTFNLRGTVISVTPTTFTVISNGSLAADAADTGGLVTIYTTSQICAVDAWRLIKKKLSTGASPQANYSAKRVQGMIKDGRAYKGTWPDSIDSAATQALRTGTGTALVNGAASAGASSVTFDNWAIEFLNIGDLVTFGGNSGVYRLTSVSATVAGISPVLSGDVADNAAITVVGSAMCSNGTLATAPMKQRIYIADYSVNRAKGTDGVISGAQNNVLDSASYTDWTAATWGIELGDMVEITQPALGMRAMTCGIAIGGLVAGSITLDRDLGAGGKCSFRIARGPKIWDIVTNVVSHWRTEVREDAAEGYQYLSGSDYRQALRGKNGFRGASNTEFDPGGLVGSQGSRWSRLGIDTRTMMLEITAAESASNLTNGQYQISVKRTLTVGAGMGAADIWNILIGGDVVVTTTYVAADTAAVVAGRLVTNWNASTDSRCTPITAVDLGAGVFELNMDAPGVVVEITTSTEDVAPVTTPTLPYIETLITSLACATGASTANSRADWKIGKLKGQVPLGCRMIQPYRGRLVSSGDPDNPNAFYATRAGAVHINEYLYDDTLDYDYFPGDPTDGGRAFAGGIGDAGQVGHKITAIMPYNDSYFLFGGDTAMDVMRGDIAQGGVIDNLSHYIGTVNARAWCFGPRGEMYFLSHDGLYVVSPGAQGVPIPLSKSIPRELLNWDSDTWPVMAFDLHNRVTWIFRSSFTQPHDTHWFFDDVSKGFWPVKLGVSTITPICVMPFGSSSDGIQSPMFGCLDGKLRQFHPDAETDDGNNMSSYVHIGPIMLGDSGLNEGLLLELRATMAKGTSSSYFSWQAFSGESPYEALDTWNNLSPVSLMRSGTWTEGMNRTDRPRLRGKAAYLRLIGTAGRRWGMENIVAVREVAGVQRL